MPGSTPTAVPTVTPMTAHIRFIGVSATLNPWASEIRVSMLLGRLFGRGEQVFQHAAGQVQVQAIVEDHEGQGSECYADADIQRKAPAAEGAGYRDEQKR